MEFDIRTLAILLSIISFVQAIVISFQYLINRTYKGIGWWVSGFALFAIGFVLTITRDITSIGLISIVAANSILFLGLIFVYTGILHFLDKNVYRNRLISLFAAFIVTVSYYTYSENNVSARAVVISAFLAGLTLRMAYVLFTGKLKSITFSANLVAGGFLSISCFFIFRALIILISTPLDSYFKPTPMQVSLFLFSLIAMLLETYGFILMVNQRLNAEIKETHEIYERIFNTSPDGAALARLDDGLIMMLNEGFTALTGFTREEVVRIPGMSLNMWNDIADRKKYIKELQEKGYCDNYEVLFKRKDGRLYFGLLSARIIILHGVMHIASFTRDITDRKKVEKALQASEERYRQLANNMTDAVTVWDINSFQFLYVSPSAERLFGYTGEEFLKYTINKMVPQEYLPKLQEYISRSIEVAKVDISYMPPLVETPILMKDGGVIWVEATLSFIHDNTGVIMAGQTVSRDISKRKLAEEALKKERERLQKALAEVKTLRGIVPICANCKQIRDDQGYWNQVETYVSEHSEAKFTHGICPDCIKKLYPEYVIEE